MAQATADMEETPSATLEQDSDNGFAAMLQSFANDEAPSDSTTSPSEEAESSATLESTDTPEATPTMEEAPPEEVVTPESILAQLNELKSKSKQSADGLGGRLGSLEQALKSLQAVTGTSKAKVRGSIDRFGEFGKEYPDFAKAQVEFINGILDELELPSISPEYTANLAKEASAAAESAAEKRFAQIRAAECQETLDETHPGWEDIVGLPDKDVSEGGVVPDTEYRRWLATQPEAYQQRVLGSYSAVVTGRSIDKFQDWKKAQTKSPSKPTAPTSASLRQQRLGAAVTAKSSSTVEAPKKAESGFEAMMNAWKEQ